MALEAIFASKLYRASSRQSELKAAINNPMNKELVIQLQSYLDPEYRKPKEKSNFVERSAESHQERFCSELHPVHFLFPEACP